MSQTVTQERTVEVPRCPMCGAGSLMPSPEESSVLFAVSDVLVYKALENLGKRIVREERGRFNELDGRPWHVAHTLWLPGISLVEKTLRGAWDIVPAMLTFHRTGGVSAERVQELLHLYVAELALCGRAHTRGELLRRFSRDLGFELIPGGWDESHDC